MKENKPCQGGSSPTEPEGDKVLSGWFKSSVACVTLPAAGKGGGDVADEGKQTGGDAWGDDISEERQAELEQRLQAWEQEADHGERKGPFDGVLLRGADVFWLAARTLAGTGESQAVTEQKERLLRAPYDVLLMLELRFEGLHLEGVHLS